MISITSFLDCKQEHMMKNGAPPDESLSPVPSVTFRISWFHKQN